MIKVLLVLVIVAVAGVVWTTSSGRFAGVMAQAAPQPTTANAASAGQQTIEIREADLTQRLRQQLVGQQLGNTPLGPATLTSITAHLLDGHLQADGDAQVGSASVPVSLTASSVAQDGKALVHVDDLRASGVPLPSSVRSALEQQLQTQVDQEVSQQHLRVTAVSIANGTLTLIGSR